MIENLIKSQKELLAAERHRSIVNLAAQVAHDIRSPLAALVVLLPELRRMPENMRIIGRNAIHRVQDIANLLLDYNKALVLGKETQISARLEPVLLQSVVESVIAEMRLRFRSRLGVLIEAACDASGYGLFVRVEQREMKRILSNLMSNSVEAISEVGTVCVRISRCDSGVMLAISDNGVGIPESFRPSLGSYGG